MRLRVGALPVTDRLDPPEELRLLFHSICIALDTPYSNCTNGEVRLVGSGAVEEGRLEVCVNSAWGTVCGEGFGDSDAAVACQSLGGYNESGMYIKLCLYNYK